MDIFSLKQWSPYIVGIGIGLLNCLVAVLLDKFIGCSTAFSRTAGLFERLVKGSGALERPYYKKFIPEVDWELMLVAGIAAGAFCSAQLSGAFTASWVPSHWASAFGDSALLRFFVALAGGIIMGLGARWAGGCTSGHGISGTMQLAVSSWIASLCFFAGGIATAALLFKII